MQNKNKDYRQSIAYLWSFMSCRIFMTFLWLSRLKKFDQIWYYLSTSMRRLLYAYLCLILFLYRFLVDWYQRYITCDKFTFWEMCKLKKIYSFKSPVYSYTPHLLSSIYIIYVLFIYLLSTIYQKCTLGKHSFSWPM